MEPNGVWKNAHGFAPLSPTNITHKLHHNHQEQEEQKQAEYMKKMKFNSTANWLGLADNTCCNHYCTTDNTSVSLPPASFGSTRRIDHPILQLHPYHNHHHHRHQQLLPEKAIAKSSLPWQLGSNMRGQDNQSRINLAHDGRESLINFVSTVDGAGGGGAHKWYNNTPDDEWATRAALRSNHHMVDPTYGFLTYNNMQQSFMNYTGNNSNNNNTALIKKGGGSSSSNNKDRHSKVFTSKGVRDRRIRLAVTTATQFYDIQDRLGYEQPSKAMDWLMSKARASIDELPRMETHSTLPSRQCTASLEPPRATRKPNSDPSHQYVRGTDQIQDIINGNPHAVEDEQQVLKVVSGVEMSLADEPGPPRSVPCIWGGIDLAAAASFSSSSLPCNGMQLREHSLKRCRSDKHN